MSKQPEALHLAERLDADATSGDMGRKPDPKCHKRKAAAELRRLHEMNTELVEAAENSISQITSHLMLLKCDDEFISSQTQQLRAAIAKATGEKV